MSGAPQVRTHGRVTLYDLHPPAGDLCADVARGLAGPTRILPPKYFYDEHGARLFERITELEAYYPTRTERSILERCIGEMAREIGPHARIVEFGSGSGEKTRILLERLESPVSYVPIDISRTQLVQWALSVADRFPALEVTPICADYTRDFPLPSGKQDPERTVAFFPGSTLGNFEPDQAEDFLRWVGELCGADGGLLIGVDLRKDPAVIQGAYNDPEGVTAEFNLNLLARINRECGADFDLAGFRHHAPYDPRHGRVEMRLVSLREQTVHLPARGDAPATEIHFRPGEHITTEYSYKYDPEDFRQMAERAGWRVEHLWTDERRWFGIWMLGRGNTK